MVAAIRSDSHSAQWHRRGRQRSTRTRERFLQCLPPVCGYSFASRDQGVFRSCHAPEPRRRAWPRLDRGTRGSGLSLYRLPRGFGAARARKSQDSVRPRRPSIPGRWIRRAGRNGFRPVEGNLPALSSEFQEFGRSGLDAVGLSRRFDPRRERRASMCPMSFGASDGRRCLRVFHEPRACRSSMSGMPRPGRLDGDSLARRRARGLQRVKIAR